MPRCELEQWYCTCLFITYGSVCAEPPTADQEEQEVEKGNDKKKKKKDKNRTKTKDGKVENKGKPAGEEDRMRKNTPVTGKGKTQH